jgi:hypothetical protein
MGFTFRSSLKMIEHRELFRAAQFPVLLEPGLQAPQEDSLQMFCSGCREVRWRLLGRQHGAAGIGPVAR